MAQLVELFGVHSCGTAVVIWGCGYTGFYGNIWQHTKKKQRCALRFDSAWDSCQKDANEEKVSWPADSLEVVSDPWNLRVNLLL